MVKQGQVYRNMYDGTLVLILGRMFYKTVLITVLNKEHHLYKIPGVAINLSSIKKNYSLVVNNYAAK